MTRISKWIPKWTETDNDSFSKRRETLLQKERKIQNREKQSLDVVKIIAHNIKSYWIDNPRVFSCCIEFLAWFRHLSVPLLYGPAPGKYSTWYPSDLRFSSRFSAIVACIWHLFYLCVCNQSWQLWRHHWLQHQQPSSFVNLDRLTVLLCSVIVPSRFPVVFSDCFELTGVDTLPCYTALSFWSAPLLWVHARYIASLSVAAKVLIHHSPSIVKLLLLDYLAIPGHSVLKVRGWWPARLSATGFCYTGSGTA